MSSAFTMCDLPRIRETRGFWQIYSLCFCCQYPGQLGAATSASISVSLLNSFSWVLVQTLAQLCPPAYYLIICCVCCIHFSNVKLWIRVASCLFFLEKHPFCKSFPSLCLSSLQNASGLAQSLQPVWPSPFWGYSGQCWLFQRICCCECINCLCAIWKCIFCPEMLTSPRWSHVSVSHS